MQNVCQIMYVYIFHPTNNKIISKPKNIHTFVGVRFVNNLTLIKTYWFLNKTQQWKKSSHTSGAYLFVLALVELVLDIVDVIYSVCKRSNEFTKMDNNVCRLLTNSITSGRSSTLSFNGQLLLLILDSVWTDALHLMLSIIIDR